MMPQRMVRLAVQLKSERKRVAGKKGVGLMVPKMARWMALKRADCWALLTGAD